MLAELIQSFLPESTRWCTQGYWSCVAERCFTWLSKIIHAQHKGIGNEKCGVHATILVILVVSKYFSLSLHFHLLLKIIRIHVFFARLCEGPLPIRYILDHFPLDIGQTHVSSQVNQTLHFQNYNQYLQNYSKSYHCEFKK